MAKSHMGSWRNPPLGYVVAQIRLSVFYQLERYVPEFQGEVRDIFPRTKEGNILRVEVQGNTPSAQQEKVWRFFSENQRMGIDLSPRSLSLHATEYRNFEAFCEPLKLMVSAAEKSIPGLFVEQLGLRYIDYILPRENEAGFDYVVESVRGFIPPGAAGVKEAYWIAHFPFEEGGINLRVIPLLPAGATHPPNFGPIDVEPAETQAEATRRAQHNEPLGCIDTDRILPLGKKIETDQVMSLFAKMHSDVSTTFQAAISQKAKQLWK